MMLNVILQLSNAVVCHLCVIGNVLEIEPRSLRLDDIIGEGQFGDVYRGTYMTLVCASVHMYYCTDIATYKHWSGVVVARWSRSVKLTYVRPG